MFIIVDWIIPGSEIIFSHQIYPSFSSKSVVKHLNYRLYGGFLILSILILL